LGDSKEQSAEKKEGKPRGGHQVRKGKTEKTRLGSERIQKKPTTPNRNQRKDH